MAGPIKDKPRHIGLPYHGEVSGGLLTLPNATTMPVYHSVTGDTCLLIQAPVVPADDRTAAEITADDAAGKTRPSYALASGLARNLAGRPLGETSWIYCDANGKAWHMSCEPAADASGITLTVSCSGRFGYFPVPSSTAPSPATLDSVLLPGATIIGAQGAWDYTRFTPICRDFMVVPSPDGSDVLINVYVVDSASDTTATYGVGHCRDTTSAPTPLELVSVHRIAVSLDGAGYPSASIASFKAYGDIPRTNTDLTTNEGCTNPLSVSGDCAGGAKSVINGVEITTKPYNYACNPTGATGGWVEGPPLTYSYFSDGICVSTILQTRICTVAYVFTAAGAVVPLTYEYTKLTGHSDSYSLEWDLSLDADTCEWTTITEYTRSFDLWQGSTTTITISAGATTHSWTADAVTFNISEYQVGEGAQTNCVDDLGFVGVQGFTPSQLARFGLHSIYGIDGHDGLTVVSAAGAKTAVGGATSRTSIPTLHPVDMTWSVPGGFWL